MKTISQQFIFSLLLGFTAFVLMTPQSDAFLSGGYKNSKNQNLKMSVSFLHKKSAQILIKASI